MYPRQSLILLVEDNPDHAELTKSCLTQCTMAGPGTTQSEAPYVGGLEVLRVIRNSNRLRALLVVMLVTSEAERDVREAYQFSANGYTDLPQFSGPVIASQFRAFQSTGYLSLLEIRRYLNRSGGAGT